MIGSLQWSIILGRFDIAVAVMTMSGFRSAPRKGHLERLKRIYGYLYKFRDSRIRFHVYQPDLSHIVLPRQNWESVYGDIQKDLPTDE